MGHVELYGKMSLLLLFLINTLLLMKESRQDEVL